MSLRQVPFSQLLQDRSVFGIFDDVFQKGTWLDVSVLLASESCIDDAYRDGSIPKETLDEIVTRLESSEQQPDTADL